MALPHRTYPRIATRCATASGEWVATEKIHGANFVVATDGNEVYFGKRKTWLKGDDAFFGWQMLRSRVRAGLEQLHAALGRSRATRVYGELFGGAYPHPDVPVVPGMSAVQTGVWYSPALEFAAFDVLVEDPEPRFLGFDEMTSGCEAAALSTSPLVGRGTAAQLIALDVHRPTAVPASFRFPPIEGNVAEGLVLKPAEGMPSDARPVLKRKIVEFQETRFEKAVAFDPGAYLSLPDLLSLCRCCVNEARVMSARSKVGTAPEAVREEVVLDVMVDLEAMFPRRFASLSAAETEAIQDRIRELASL